MQALNILLVNDIQSIILRSIFESTNIGFTNAEHRTNNVSMRDIINISNPIIETSLLIDFHATDIDANEMMQNVVRNIQKNLYLSYTHGSSMVDDNDNNDLIAGMFPNLFPYGIAVAEMNNYPIKITVQTHIRYLINLDNKLHEF